MKSVRKLSTEEFMNLIRDEFDKLMNPKINSDFADKMQAITQRISDEIKQEVESLTYLLTDEFYDEITDELKSNILSRIQRDSQKGKTKYEPEPNLIDEMLGKYFL